MLSPVRPCTPELQKMQDTHRFVRFGLDINQWQRDVPSVETARPSRCGGCAVASRPVGEGLQLHGHGLRVRLLFGLLSADCPPGVHEVTLRRYQCLCCGAITTVGPRGLVRRHLYGLATIVLALWLWSQGEPAARVRDRVRPWEQSGAGCADRWASLGRWACHLPWPSALLVMAGWTAREQAARRAQAALAHAPPGRACAASVMAGATQLG